MRRYGVLVVVLTLVAAACAQPASDNSGGVSLTETTTIVMQLDDETLNVAPPVGEDSAMPRPEPDEPARGDAVSTIESDGATFALFDEGAGCMAVDIGYPGLQRTVERRCFQGLDVVDMTSSCGWLEVAEDGSFNGCDVELPRVFFGPQRGENIGYVCVGTFSEGAANAGVTGARFVEQTLERYTLVAAGPGESAVAHLFTQGGYRIGEPPLDAPSGPIYRFCEAQAPWRTSNIVYNVDLYVSFGEGIQNGDVEINMHSGLDSVTVAGGDFGVGETQVVPIRISAASPDIEFELLFGGEPRGGWALEWPIALQKILASDKPCDSPIVIGVDVDAGVIDGVDSAYDMYFIGSSCAQDP